MQWYGKMTGGLLGLAFGGPVGALLGLAIGHQFDRGAAAQLGGASGAGRLHQARVQAAFFSTTFAVMGHLSKASGRVSEKEIRTARAVMVQMHLSPEQVKQAIAFFNDGKRSDFPLRRELRRFREQCGGRRDLRRAFLEIQCQAALASGTIGGSEREILWRIAGELGFSRVELAQIEALIRMHRGFSTQDARASQKETLEEAYRVLGVRRDAADKEVKIAYRRLMNQHHPDKLVAKGLPESMMTLAKEKTREINKAYDAVKAARGIK